MRQRSVALAALAVLIVAAAVAATAVIQAGRSGAAAAQPIIAPPVWTDGGGRVSLGAGSSVQAPTGPLVTVPALAATGSALHTPSGSAAPSPPDTTRATPTGTSPSGPPVTATASAAARGGAGPGATHSPAPPTSPPPATTPTTASSSTAPATYPSHVDSITPAPTVSAGRIRQAVDRAVHAAAGKGITESVVVLDRHTGRTIVSDDADRPVPAVSIAKLLFAADQLDQAGGGANLDPDAAGDLFDMIRRSNDALASDYYGYHGESEVIERVAKHYHLTGTSPAPNPRYWGGITVTASDVASLLRQLLSDPADGPYLAAPMRAASQIAADGFDQEFGMNAVSGAGSKQGWGCCLGGVVAIHSAGFTANEIVVVLSTAYPDATGLNVPEVSAFDHDPGFLASIAAVTATARAAVAPT